jgi:hypothetical protein
LNGLNRTFLSIIIATVCIGGIAGCNSGDEGGANAEGVKNLAKDPSNTTNNNPDVPPLTKDQLAVTGSKPGGK